MTGAVATRAEFCRMHLTDCPLCQPVSETPLWQDTHCRVILAHETGYPVLCRVIWQAHVREMTDLNASQQAHLMRVVFATERALRTLLQPDKVNLASLGNLVPHLHWHVIPRFRDDRNFPDPIWSVPRRNTTPDAVQTLSTDALCRQLGLELTRQPGT